MGACLNFLWRGCVIFLTTVPTVKKYLLNTFGNSNLTNLKTDVMFSRQHFAILAIFFMKLGGVGPIDNRPFTSIHSSKIL